jgi:hypothetical protein
MLITPLNIGDDTDGSQGWLCPCPPTPTTMMDKGKSEAFMIASIVS